MEKQKFYQPIYIEHLIFLNANLHFGHLHCSVSVGLCALFSSFASHTTPKSIYEKGLINAEIFILPG